MMARGKKNESALNPKENLAQALVPDWERPYKVPQNWCWTTVDKVATVVTGGTPSKNHPEYYGGTFPFYKPSDLDAGRYVYEASEYLSDAGKSVSRIIPQDSTAVCCIGSIGKCGYITREGTTNQQINSVIPRFNPLYLYYFLNTDQFINELWSKASATTISIVNKSKMEQCYFPLAPLAEQQRIVDRIEYLFAKLDEAKEKAQSVLDSFETRKAAILYKAFSGELTAKWRTKQGCSVQWEPRKLGAIVATITDKYDPTKDTKTDLPYIGLEHIQKGTGIIGFGSVADVKSLKSVFRAGDILYGKLRPYLDKHGITTFDGVCSTDILVYRASTEHTAKYVNYLFSTKAFIEYAVENSKGINLPRTSAAAISSFVVQVPAEKEQAEIVRILDNLFAKEQQAKEAAEAVLEKIDLLKKSVLARAFHGELDTNDPTEESALELLKQVLQEDVPAVPKKRSKSIPKELQAKLSTELERKIVKLYFKQEADSLPAEELLSVSSKKFEVMDSLHNLEQRGILKKLPNGNYRLLE